MKHETKTKAKADLLPLVDKTTGEIMATPLIRTHHNSKYFAKSYERNNQPSKTQPHQSLTIREILDRYAKGLPLDVERKIYFDENENSFDFDSFKRLDISEQQELIAKAKLDVKEKQDELIKLNQKKRLEAYQNQVKEEVEKRLKELSNKNEKTNEGRTTTEAKPQ